MVFGAEARRGEVYVAKGPASWDLSDGLGRSQRVAKWVHFETSTSNSLLPDSGRSEFRSTLAQYTKTWLPHLARASGSHADPKWVPGGSQPDPRRIPIGSQVDPLGIQVDPKWIPGGSQVDPQRIPGGFQLRGCVRGASTHGANGKLAENPPYNTRRRGPAHISDAKGPLLPLGPTLAFI